MAQPTKQYTVQYKTFLKRAIRSALAASFVNHIDPTVKSARVALDFGKKDFTLPAVIVKFIEKDLPNAGLGHYEWLPDPNVAGQFIEYQHRLYHGNLEFDIYGETTTDRDLVSDALVEILAMDEVSTPGQTFLTLFYSDLSQTPFGQWHFPTLNLDLIEPSGEQPVMAPWRPEDVLVYQTGYRVPVMGEFYSYTPPTPNTLGTIGEVDVYQWPVDGKGNPIDPKFPAGPTIPPGKAEQYTGWPAGAKTVPTG